MIGVAVGFGIYVVNYYVFAPLLFPWLIGVAQWHGADTDSSCVRNDRCGGLPQVAASHSRLTVSRSSDARLAKVLGTRAVTLTTRSTFACCFWSSSFGRSPLT